MKTLSINPFNPKSFLKRVCRTQKRIEIPNELSDELYIKLTSVKHSLDYMATNYDINFVIQNDPMANAFHVTCSNDMCECNSHQITASDDETTVAQKIYKAASNVLLGYKKYK